MSQDTEKKPQAQILKNLLEVLEDKKAENLSVLDVHDLTSVTDTMVIATGSSHVQLRAMMNALLSILKEKNVAVVGVEGEQNGEWILLDAGSILIHLMLPQIRSYYELEKLWSVRPGE